MRGRAPPARTSNRAEQASARRGGLRRAPGNGRRWFDSTYGRHRYRRASTRSASVNRGRPSATTAASSASVRRPHSGAARRRSRSVSASSVSVRIPNPRITRLARNERDRCSMGTADHEGRSLGRRRRPRSVFGPRTSARGERSPCMIEVAIYTNNHVEIYCDGPHRASVRRDLDSRTSAWRAALTRAKCACT